jgi:hypothetical protein
LVEEESLIAGEAVAEQAAIAVSACRVTFLASVVDLVGKGSVSAYLNTIRALEEVTLLAGIALISSSA